MKGKILFLIMFLLTPIIAQQCVQYPSPNILEMIIWEPFANTTKPLAEYLDSNYEYVIFTYSLDFCSGGTIFVAQDLADEIHNYPNLKVIFVVSFPVAQYIAEHVKYLRKSWMGELGEIIPNTNRTFWINNNYPPGQPAIAFIKKGIQFWDIRGAEEFFQNKEHLIAVLDSIAN